MATTAIFEHGNKQLWKEEFITCTARYICTWIWREL